MARKINNVLLIVLNVIGVCFILWLVVSYFDVLAHQFNGGTQNTWNLFNILIKMFPH